MAFEETFRSVALTLARTAAFTSHAFLFGGLAIILLVLRPSFGSLENDAWAGGRRRVSERLEGIMQACLTGSAVATLVALALQAALVSEGTGGQVDSDSIFGAVGTRFGQLYLLRFPLLVGLSILLVGRVRQWALAGAGDGGRAPGTGWWVGWGALSGALLLTSTLSGHAAVAVPRLVSIVTDMSHLVCGAIWFAGIVILSLVLPDGWRGKDDLDRVKLLAPAVTRFSKIALVVFSLLGMTGVVNSFLHIGALDDLWDTSYGRALSAKIIVYGLILVLAAVNHFVLTRKLEAARDTADAAVARRTFRKTIAAELALALLVMGLTGLLTGLGRTKQNVPPPAGDIALSAER
jgi:putative copper export protein